MTSHNATKQDSEGNRKEKANSARRYMVEEKDQIDRYRSNENLQDEYTED